MIVLALDDDRNSGDHAPMAKCMAAPKGHYLLVLLLLPLLLTENVITLREEKEIRFKSIN